jgi:hypothetical protein
MRKIMIDTNIYALFKRTKIYHDLDHLAGTWSEKDLKVFFVVTKTHVFIALIRGKFFPQ